MTKTYPIIHLNGFIYMVDEKEIPYNPNGGTNGLFICLSEIEQNKQHGVKLGDEKYCSPLVTNVGNCSACRIILASNDPSLGLPLLPDIEEDIEQLALSIYPEIKHLTQASNTDIEKQISKRIGFVKGYKAAKAKGYTEEDMKDIVLCAPDKQCVDEAGSFENWFKRYLQSLNPLPIAVEVEMDIDNPCPKCGKDNTHGNYDYSKPNTPLIDTLCNECGTVFLPIPKVDENNIIQIVKWIYGNNISTR